MINAKEARELTEASLIEIKKATWVKIENNIKEAIDKGSNSCNVWVREEIAESIEWNLKNVYYYTVGYDHSIPRPVNPYFKNSYCMTISW